MEELVLSRSIMLDSGEIIPAGVTLRYYGEFTPLSGDCRCRRELHGSQLLSNLRI